MRDALERDKSLVELRALLASYEERLSRSPMATPESHAAQAHMPEPVFLLDDLTIDQRSSAPHPHEIIAAPGIRDCMTTGDPEPFSFVYKVASGVFRVHPRRNALSAAVIGPLRGPAPSGLVATARTTHGDAPPVRYHISTWLGEIDTASIPARLGEAGEQARFLTVPPRHSGYIVATDCPRPASPADPEAAWGLLFATIADPPETIANAWAEFSDIALIFSTDGGPEVRLLG